MTLPDTPHDLPVAFTIDLQAREAFARATRLIDHWDLAGLQDAASALAAMAGPRAHSSARVYAQVLLLHLAVLCDDQPALLEHLRSARFAAVGCRDDHVLAVLEVAAARGLFYLGEGSEGLAELEAAWPRAQRSGDNWLCSLCALLHARTFRRLRQTDAALSWSELALALCRDR